jgi:putative transcriptional regulator
MLKIIDRPKSGCLLIPDAFLPDPNFSRSVVLLVEHNEDGSLGFVLNKASGYTLEQLVHNMACNAPVWTGGPVQPETLHWLHRYQQLEGAVEISNGIYWGGDYEQLKTGLQNGNFRQEDLRFFHAYSGWAAGQLENELAEGSWIISEASAAVVFNPLKSEQQLWKTLMKALGGEYALLANAPEKPWLN